MKRQNEVIKTKRLILRKFKSGDEINMFNNWCNDPEVTKYMTWNPHENIDVTKNILNTWIKEYDDPKTIRYGIVLKENNELIGSIDVVSYVNNVPEIGYCLSRKYWNKGYMTEACLAFINQLKELGFKKVIIEADINNISSNRVIIKCGFKFVRIESRTPCSMFKPETVTVNWYELDL